MNLHLLIADECDNDVELTVHHLRMAGCQVEFACIRSAEAMAAELNRESPWNLILFNSTMQDFSPQTALLIWRESGLEIPFIVLSEAIGEEAAVSLVKAGAHDLVLKENRPRLISVIKRELNEAAERRKRRELEQEHLQTIRQLKQALQIRDDFLSIASHELKTPLTPLKLQHQRILKDLEEEQNLTPASFVKMRAVLSQAVRQIDRLNFLVEELLDVSRIRAGRLSLSLRQANLTNLVYDVVERFSERIKAANCNVTVEAPPDIWGYFDLYRMDSVLTNLLDNALKYGAGKPIRISLQVIDDQAVISVRDSGIGIHEKDLLRIFDRFERAVSFSNYGGLGLGLYISRQILTAHGGEIRVQSALDDGSVFTIEFPLRAVQRAGSSSQLFS